MARTVSDIVVSAPAPEVMAVIADFESYPQWATGMKAVDVLSTFPDGRARTVRMTLDSPPIRDTFTLEYEWNGDHRVQWQLADRTDTMLTAMDGSYLLEPIDEGQTRVTYQLAVDVSLPLLGMLKRKAEKIIIDTALKGLKKRVETRSDA